MLILSCVSFNTFYPLLTQANIEIKTNELFYTLWSPEVEKQQSVTVRGQGIKIKIVSLEKYKENYKVYLSPNETTITVANSSNNTTCKNKCPVYMLSSEIPLDQKVQYAIVKMLRQNEMKSTKKLKLFINNSHINQFNINISVVY